MSVETSISEELLVATKGTPVERAAVPNASMERLAAQSQADMSVVTPAYNCAETIRRCVESVAQQTSPVLEQIIVNDGSSDLTATVLMELAEQYSFLKIIHQENRGAGVARNKAIEMARGRFIAFLDADDYWLPHKVATQVAFMKLEKCALSYGEYYIVNDDMLEDDLINNATVYSPPSVVAYRDLLRSCPMGCLTVAYDQHVLGKVYMPELRRGQDWALWLKITRNGTLAHKYPGQHAVYYVQTGSLSNNKIKKFFDVYKVYSDSENLNSILSLYYTLVHSIKVIINRKRGASK